MARRATAMTNTNPAARRTTRHLWAAAIGMAILATAGCASAETAPEPTTTAPHGDNGPATTWQVSDGPAQWVCIDHTTAVTYRIPVPTPVDDPRVVAVEGYRTKAGAPPVNYTLVEIDATTPGTTPGRHGVWGAGWADANQQNVNAQRLLHTTMGWPGWSSNPGADVPEVEQDANTGAKGWALLTTEQPVDHMVAPTVTTGVNQVPCELYPAQ